jgi:uncharacterized protein (TIRG00374 family)
MNWRYAALAAQAGVTAILLALLGRGLDLQAFRAMFASLPAWFYLFSLAVVLAGQVAYAGRWRLLLLAAGVRVPFTLILRQYFIGIFLNNFLPSTVGGDLGKVYLLGRHHGYGLVFASVVLDRILGLSFLALSAAALLWMLPMPSPLLAGARFTITGIAVVSACVLLVIATGTGGLHTRLSWMGPRVVGVAQRLQRLRIDVGGALRRPLLLVQAAAVVIVYCWVVGVVYVVFIRMQVRQQPSLAMTTAIMMTISILSFVPISLNGLGVREQLHVALLAPIGVPGEVAVAISLLLFGHLLVASAGGLVFWLWARGRPPLAAS